MRISPRIPPPALRGLRFSKVPRKSTPPAPVKKIGARAIKKNPLPKTS